MATASTEAADLTGLSPDHDGEGSMRVITNNSAVANNGIEGMIEGEVRLDKGTGIDDGAGLDLLSGGIVLHITKNKTPNINTWFGQSRGWMHSNSTFEYLENGEEVQTTPYPSPSKPLNWASWVQGTRYTGQYSRRLTQLVCLG